MGERHRGTTVRSRELGARVRRVTEASGISGQELARRIGWSQSEVSRLMTGKLKVNSVDIATIAGVCAVSNAERKRLLRLCDEANKPGWWQQHGSRLPKQLQTLIDHEDKAVTLTDFEPSFMPGLLQTGEYARAVIRSSVNFPAEELDERVASRLERQHIFDRVPSSRYTFFMHESVLRTAAGGDVVMSGQLHHLMSMSVRPHIELRVLPASIGCHAGNAGPFIFMEFAEIEPVTYLESETSTLFLEDPEETTAYRNVVAALANIALNERQSVELIRTLAVELYGGHEDHDHFP